MANPRILGPVPRAFHRSPRRQGLSSRNTTSPSQQSPTQAPLSAEGARIQQLEQQILNSKTLSYRPRFDKESNFNPTSHYTEFTKRTLPDGSISYTENAPYKTSGSDRYSIHSIKPVKEIIVKNGRITSEKHWTKTRYRKEDKRELKFHETPTRKMTAWYDNDARLKEKTTIKKDLGTVEKTRHKNKKLTEQLIRQGLFIESQGIAAWRAASDAAKDRIKSEFSQNLSKEKVKKIIKDTATGTYKTTLERAPLTAQIQRGETIIRGTTQGIKDTQKFIQALDLQEKLRNTKKTIKELAKQGITQAKHMFPQEYVETKKEEIKESVQELTQRTKNALNSIEFRDFNKPKRSALDTLFHGKDESKPLTQKQRDAALIWIGKITGENIPERHYNQLSDDAIRVTLLTLSGKEVPLKQEYLLASGQSADFLNTVKTLNREDYTSDTTRLTQRDRQDIYKEMDKGFRQVSESEKAKISDQSLKYLNLAAQGITLTTRESQELWNDIEARKYLVNNNLVHMTPQQQALFNISPFMGDFLSNHKDAEKIVAEIKDLKNTPKYWETYLAQRQEPGFKERMETERAFAIAQLTTPSAFKEMAAYSGGMAVLDVGATAFGAPWLAETVDFGVALPSFSKGVLKPTPTNVLEAQIEAADLAEGLIPLSMFHLNTRNMIKPGSPILTLQRQLPQPKIGQFSNVDITVTSERGIETKHYEEFNTEAKQAFENTLLKHMDSLELISINYKENIKKRVPISVNINIDPKTGTVIKTRERGIKKEVITYDPTQETQVLDIYRGNELLSTKRRKLNRGSPSGGLTIEQKGLKAERTSALEKISDPTKDTNAQEVRERYSIGKEEPIGVFMQLSPKDYISVSGKINTLSRKEVAIKPKVIEAWNNVLTYVQDKKGRRLTTEERYPLYRKLEDYTLQWEEDGTVDDLVIPGTISMHSDIKNDINTKEFIEQTQKFIKILPKETKISQSLTASIHAEPKTLAKAKRRIQSPFKKGTLTKSESKRISPEEKALELDAEGKITFYPNEQTYSMPKNAAGAYWPSTTVTPEIGNIIDAPGTVAKPFKTTPVMAINKNLKKEHRPKVIAHELIHHYTPGIDKFDKIANKYKIPYRLQPDEILAFSLMKPVSKTGFKNKFPVKTKIFTPTQKLKLVKAKSYDDLTHNTKYEKSDLIKGAHGYYNVHTDTIHVSKELSETKAESAARHERIHQLIQQQNIGDKGVKKALKKIGLKKESKKLTPNKREELLVKTLSENKSLFKRVKGIIKKPKLTLSTSKFQKPYVKTRKERMPALGEKFSREGFTTPDVRTIGETKKILKQQAVSLPKYDFKIPFTTASEFNIRSKLRINNTLKNNIKNELKQNPKLNNNLKNELNNKLNNINKLNNQLKSELALNTKLTTQLKTQLATQVSHKASGKVNINTAFNTKIFTNPEQHNEFPGRGFLAVLHGPQGQKQTKTFKDYRSAAWEGAELTDETDANAFNIISRGVSPSEFKRLQKRKPYKGGKKYRRMGTFYQELLPYQKDKRGERNKYSQMRNPMRLFT